MAHFSVNICDCFWKTTNIYYVRVKLIFVVISSDLSLRARHFSVLTPHFGGGRNTVLNLYVEMEINFLFPAIDVIARIKYF